MKRYSLILLPVLLGVLISGCDSQCCSKVESTPAVDNKAPIAKMVLNGTQANGECTPGDAITLTPQSTDSDGTVTDNIWKVDGTVVGNTTVTCPDDGKTKTICLTAVDNDGKQSPQVCKTLTGKAVQAQILPPVSKIIKGANTGDGQFLDCTQVHDQDTIDTDGVENLYGSDKAIKEVIWTYTYNKADGTQDGPNVKTQTEYNTDEGNPAGFCKKWFHTNDVNTIDFSIKTIDDDDQTTTTDYVYDVANGTLTLKN